MMSDQSAEVAVVGAHGEGSLARWWAEGLEERGTRVRRIAFPEPPRGRVQARIERRAIRRRERRVATLTANTGDKLALAVCIKPMWWTRDDVENLRAALPNTYLAMYLPDDPVQAARHGRYGSSALAAMGAWDAVITWTDDQLPVLDRLGATSSHVVPFGWSHAHRRARPPSVGEEVVDLCFVGTWDPQREAVIRELHSTFTAASILVVGNFWDRAAPLPSDVRVMPRNVYGSDLHDLSTTARIMLNIPRPQNVGNHNMRFYEIPALGAVQAITSPMRALEPNLVLAHEMTWDLLELARDASWLARERERVWSDVAACSYADRICTWLAKMEQT